MKNTKNFIIVGAMLLFSAISTCGFAQKNSILDIIEDFVLDPSSIPIYREDLDLDKHINKFCQQWDSLYLANDADNLAKMYTEVVYVRKADGSIKAKTREQIKNSFNNKFAKIKILSFSSQLTGTKLESDGTWRVRGTFVGMVDLVGIKSKPIQISGAYDRNVIYVNGKYKICKHKDIVN